MMMMMMMMIDDDDEACMCCGGNGKKKSVLNTVKCRSEPYKATKQQKKLDCNFLVKRYGQRLQEITVTEETIVFIYKINDLLLVADDYEKLDSEFGVCSVWRMFGVIITCLTWNSTSSTDSPVCQSRIHVNILLS
jgi:hypothetical protein